MYTELENSLFSHQSKHVRLLKLRGFHPRCGEHNRKVMLVVDLQLKMERTDCKTYLKEYVRIKRTKTTKGQ